METVMEKCPNCGMKNMDPHNKWIGPDKKTYCKFSHLPENYKAKIKSENPNNPFMTADHIGSAFGLALGLHLAKEKV